MSRKAFDLTVLGLPADQTKKGRPRLDITGSRIALARERLLRMIDEAVRAWREGGAPSGGLAKYFTPVERRAGAGAQIAALLKAARWRGKSGFDAVEYERTEEIVTQVLAVVV